MSDFIYIISNDLGYIKVGVSKNPNKRLKQLQTGNEHKLFLLFSEEFECSRKHLLHIETAIHKQLKINHQNVSGEWFLIDKGELESIKNTVIYYRIRYENDLTSFSNLR